MEKRFYAFAGMEFELHIPAERIYTEEYRLAAFRVDTVKDPHVIRFSWVDRLSEPQGTCIAHLPTMQFFSNGEESIRYVKSSGRGWEDASVRIRSVGKQHWAEILRARYPARISTKTVLESMWVEHHIAENGGFILHSACIAVQGRAILFTAPSGTGKSTQAELWRMLRGAEIVNGDRAIVRCADGQSLACGLPFAGSSSYCVNKTLPLAAVVYLQQAPETSIRRLQGYTAFSRLWEGCSVNAWNPADMDRVSDAVSGVISGVPVFQLACTPDESAVLALENAMKEVLNRDQ